MRNPGESAPGFDALYSRQHERIVTALVLAGSDQATAEDIAHEAFVRVLSAWARVREPDAYLYRTAFRLQNRARLTSRRTLSLLVAPAAAASADTERTAVTRADVHQVLASLSQRQRECAVLVHYLGCTTAEAADHLGIRAATVRVHLHEVRSRLRVKIIEIH